LYALDINSETQDESKTASAASKALCGAADPLRRPCTKEKEHSKEKHKGKPKKSSSKSDADDLFDELSSQTKMFSSAAISSRAQP
jgi:hypothetical protein